MKHISLCALTMLSFSNYLVAMDSAHELTAEEKNCYEWATKQKEFLATFKQLSDKDREVFNKQLPYNNHPVEVTESRTRYAEIFCKLAQEAGTELPYDTAMFANTFLKMKKIMDNQAVKKPTDLISARMYAFTQLSPAEKLAYSQENYGKNPEATTAVVRKWSQATCNELAKLKLIEDTQQAKDDKAQELYDDQLNRFKQAYASDQK